MTIVNFTTPSDDEIIDTINISTNDAVGFIGRGSVYQNLNGTTYVRLIELKNKNSVKKVTYKKSGMMWGFDSIEEVKSEQFKLD